MNNLDGGQGQPPSPQKAFPLEVICTFLEGENMTSDITNAIRFVDH